MSVYPSTCERFLRSPIFSAMTTIIAGVYLIRNPTIAAVIITTAGVKAVDFLQHQLRQYDLNRYKSVSTQDECPVGEKEEDEEVTEEEEVDEKDKEETYEDNEGDDEGEDEGEDEEYIPSHKPSIKKRTYNLRNR